MKQIVIIKSLPALLSAVLLGFTSCSSTPKVEKNTATAYKEGVPGGILVETYDTTTTVTRVDTRNRTVTLLAPDGSYNTFKAAPQNSTFEHLRVGEKVKTSVERELVIFLAKNGPPQVDAPVAASKQDKPLLVSKPGQRNATVDAIDTEHRQVTLKFTDGTTKTFPIRKDVDIKKAAIGDEVVILTGSSVTLSVEKQ